jgi:hypothetical protein
MPHVIAFDKRRADFQPLAGLTEQLLDASVMH